MSLGMGLVVFGFANAWQLIRVQSGGGVPPEFRWIGSANLTFVVGDVNILPPIPASLLAVRAARGHHPVRLRRTGYGRLLYAIGDNPIAVRLSGARSWQVLLVLYAISAFMAAIAGFLLSGGVNVASVTLADSLCAAVGRRGGHRRDVDHGRPRRVRRRDRRGADPDGDHASPRSLRPRCRASPRGGPPGACSGRSSSRAIA